MNKLIIAKGIDFPRNLVTQTVAILAKRRAGKSYTMRRTWEQLLHAGEQVIVVDPKGDQWGIRSSADGKKPGFPVLILGGEHGDVPLESNAGEIVAKLAVEERVSILLDLSTFRKHEIATFMTAFLENLYRLKAQEKYRTPVMLIIDEADAIAPQKPQKGEERMLGAAEDIVRRGGQRGLGCMLVTQRSAVLNKNVLTQAEMLIVLRTIAPQDLAAMKAWIDVHGDLEQGRTLMDSLPALPIGDAWFWSPGWPTAEGIFKRAHVLPIETFDSGSTPKPGEKKIVPKNLADVNLDVLKKQMAAVVEKAKAENPKELKKQIADLKAQLEKKTDKPMTSIDVNFRVEEARKEAIKETEARMEAAFWLERDEWLKQIQNWFNILKEIGLTMQEYTKTKGKLNSKKPKFSMPPIVNHSDKITKEVFLPGVIRKMPEGFGDVEITKVEITDVDPKLGMAAKNIYSVVYENRDRPLTKTQIGVMIGYSPTSSTFKNSLSALNARGLIMRQGEVIVWGGKLADELLVPTEKFTADPSLWAGKLTKAEYAMYKVLYENQVIHTKEMLGLSVGYSPTSSTFKNSLSHLNSIGLIKRFGPDIGINPEIAAL